LKKLLIRREPAQKKGNGRTCAKKKIPAVVGTPWNQKIANIGRTKKRPRGSKKDYCRGSKEENIRGGN